MLLLKRRFKKWKKKIELSKLSYSLNRMLLRNFHLMNRSRFKKKFSSNVEEKKHREKSKL